MKNVNVNKGRLPEKAKEMAKRAEKKKAPKGKKK